MRQIDLLLIIILLSVVVVLWSPVSGSGQQLNLVNDGCSTYNVSNFAEFEANLNATFMQLREHLVMNNSYFATAQQATGSNPAYAMVQCRRYLSPADCLACFDSAVSRIRNCSANGARVIYDGCFLRFESNNFYEQSTQEGHTSICGNGTAAGATAFEAAVVALLNDLRVVTPRINGYFAAAKRTVSGNATVYGVAQCVETISQSGCEDCMAVVNGDIQQCPPRPNGRAVDVGCFLRYSASSFFADNQTTDISPFLKAESSSKKKALIGGLAGGGGFLLLVLALILFFRLSRNGKATGRGDILGATELRGPLNYRYRDLTVATSNFSEEKKLGEGGFGDVYKGVLKNGKIVAVKKLAVSEQRRAKLEFESEVKLISNVHHRNLVRLLGCCSKGSELLLVYEYMPNGSLDKFLFGEKRGCLNWKQRLDIILGTARGLAYLHEEFHVCIIHRDIKPSNILLDDDFQPKIADFGLARLLPQDQSHVTTRFAGTLGYTAPEYAIHGQLSEKADAYSFGILVLEMVSGQKSTHVMKVMDDDGEYLLKRAWRLYVMGMHLELVENQQGFEFEADEAKRVIEIALMCTQAAVASRPSMSEVVVMLRSRAATLQHPPTVMPTFVDAGIKAPVDTTDTSTSTASSNATTSISRLSGR